ncbi:hypothetical protein AAKU58_003945 [Oxalobacteraceae bacterium GrIS 1.18]
MENLLTREIYGPDLAYKIEVLGNIAIEIANRWVSGWPSAVLNLLDNGTYFDLLVAQVDQEKTILANESGLRHLSPSEILSVYEISKAPPSC